MSCSVVAKHGKLDAVGNPVNYWMAPVLELLMKLPE
jgi:hypothetical protein